MRTEDIEASVDEQLVNLCSSWKASSWDELDWIRAKLLTIRDILEIRQQHLEEAENVHCLQCPNFVKHVSTCTVSSTTCLPFVVRYAT